MVHAGKKCRNSKLSSAFGFVIRDGILCSPSWSQAHHVSEDDCTLFASPCYAVVMVTATLPSYFLPFSRQNLDIYSMLASECWDYGNAPSQAWLGVLCFKMHLPPPGSPEQCITILKVERGRRGNRNEPFCNGNFQSVSSPMAHFD